MSKVRRLSSLLIGLSLGAMWVPAAASADAATCSFDPVSGVVTIAAGAGTFESLAVSGDLLLLDGAPCGGATTTDAELIQVAGGRLTVDLEDGELAPGRTPEADGSSELEVEVEASAILFDVALNGADGFAAIGQRGVALNQDGDADIVLDARQTAYINVGGSSIDTVYVITGQGGYGTGRPTKTPLWLGGQWGADHLTGGDGSDRINGGPSADCCDSHNVLEGGRGDDIVTGASNGDTIDGGPGNDLLFGAGGRDAIGGVDVMNGGPGDDQLSTAGPGSVLSGNRGNDTFYVADRMEQTVNGGAGEDSATVDCSLDRSNHVESVSCG